MYRIVQLSQELGTLLQLLWLVGRRISETSSSAWWVGCWINWVSFLRQVVRFTPAWWVGGGESGLVCTLLQLFWLVSPFDSKFLFYFTIFTHEVNIIDVIKQIHGFKSLTVNRLCNILSLWHNDQNCVIGFVILCHLVILQTTAFWVLKYPHQALCFGTSWLDKLLVNDFFWNMLCFGN